MIQVKEVSKSFDKFKALDGISCQIADGCIYGMVGSNGAGKSTFLRVITGIYKPNQGEADYDEVCVYDNPDVKDKLAYVADDLYFPVGATLDKMGKLYASIYDTFDDTRFESLLSIFKLDRKKSISGFSKGMKRQAAIILALSTRAKYMFFDETFDGLDPVMRNLVKKCICSDVADYNSTIIITSHSLRELEDICDHLVLLHKGGLVLDSDVVNLKTSRFKAQIAFNEEYTKDKFADMNIVKYKQQGSVANMIINGDREESSQNLQAMNPILLDILPLSLEEVFTYEMEALGYNFDDSFDKEYAQNSDVNGGADNE